MSRRSEAYANAALHRAAVSHHIHGHGPSAYRRQQRKQQRRETVSTAIGGLAFLVLFAACFIPLFF